MSGFFKRFWRAPLAALAVSAGAAVDSTPATAQTRPPVVVELFTSQGCYSCPPAEKLLSELSEQSGIVALEFHVDYWDELIYFIHGSWKDPFSSPVYTLRQQFYNRTIRGRGGVYTPQMVIDGRLEAVGSRRRDVARAINTAAVDSSPRVNVEIQKRADGYQAQLSGTAGERAGIWFVEFIREATTEIKKGENHGKTLTSHNIVTKMQRIGEWTGRRTAVTLPSATGKDPKLGCAILVQPGPGQGRILGASLCPS